MMMEMKKDWLDPQTIVQDFVPNEYVAACGDTGTAYKFVCNATRVGALYDNSAVYNEAGEKLGVFHPCSETHITGEKDSFINGYITSATLIGQWFEIGKTPVIIWRGTDGHNLHCTTNLDISKWETAKS